MINQMINLDYPDPDIIRVDNTYYMVSTTMHFMPGCEILRSNDLVNWEHATYVYDKLDSTKGQTLTDDEGIYGKGMWAASLRYHKGLFYICFVANDTHKTYLYTASDIYGTWKKSTIEGFYHDCSLLFDDDDRVYIVYGNKNIYLTELNSDLTAPKEGGINRLIVSDKDNPMLGYEGAHFYKINGNYYVFFIHSLADKWRRVEACFMSKSIDGEFIGKDVFNDDMGYCGQGIAQGGIVDTPEGKWYSVMFQDSGAVGRIPIIVPVTWENDFPVFGNNMAMPKGFRIESTPDNSKDLIPLIGSDNFKYKQEDIDNNKKAYDSFGLKSMWQFNHEPDTGSFELDTCNGEWIVKNQKICNRLTLARNIITQRMTYPKCCAEVTVDASNLKNGDYAGLCILQYSYGFIALKKEDNKYSLVMLENIDKDNDAYEQVHESIEITDTKVNFKISADFENMTDEACFYYKTASDREWHKLGITKKLSFSLKHFCGCRIGLVSYATKEMGGIAKFSDFRYEN